MMPQQVAPNWLTQVIGLVKDSQLDTTHELLTFQSDSLNLHIKRC